MVSGSVASSFHGKPRIRGILDVEGAHLDRAYVERWAQELDLVDLWREVTRDA